MSTCASPKVEFSLRTSSVGIGGFKGAERKLGNLMRLSLSAVGA